ncbi:methylated-DNA--[protein]-cysteine S-methyltransferase [Aminicella lysinilytica]|uniref:Methylated-DNA--protein-cysteine methyltransferase n=1 Tax=Aminicella lysinilytica TaxID=433323 RepID=A0A4R6QB19_9FIRM|nr:methylated-DNA--[protein]-cysteine S-methyltransferase [Aminicella lysinilytica]TDP58469.1 methylated-DNA-[protein]-cysteine S-methyltransferase [Aminicella lysinilytica]
MYNYAVYKLKFGYFHIEQRNGVIVGIDRLPDKPDDMGMSTVLMDSVANELAEYFDGKRREFDFPYELHGTEFQMEVWNALCDIPYGETRSYGQIAEAIGNPKASRAVGMANNRNPLMIVVPCHRVIGADGRLTGYAGGLPVKEALLRLESDGCDSINSHK